MITSANGGGHVFGISYQRGNIMGAVHITEKSVILSDDLQWLIGVNIKERKCILMYITI